MTSSLQGLDPELELLGITTQDIINSITLEDVKTFLESLGVDQIAGAIQNATKQCQSSRFIRNL